MSSFLGATKRIMHLGQSFIAFARRTDDESMSTKSTSNERCGNAS
jgi:hypothetical protein